MRVEFRGIHYFLPVLDRIAEKHEITNIVTFPFCKIAFEDIAARTGAALRALNDSERDHLIDGDADVCIVAGYPYKLAIASNTRGINIHPSLLPEGRGPSPMTNILLGRYESAGVTLHKLSSEFDRGDIISKTAIDIDFSDTYYSYIFKCSIVVASTIIDILDHLDELWSSAVPQVGGSWWRLNDPAIEQILGEDTVDVARRKYAALDQQCWFHDGNQKRNIRSLHAWLETSADAAGTIRFNATDIVVVRLMDGYALLRFS